jgi:AcrR family transcriptional regulator
MMTVNREEGGAMEEDGETGLPASIEAAWGLRERPHKGPKRELSLDRIVKAGIRLADSEGLAAVSMSRVAAAVGASTMALYRYVAAKDELLELMLDSAHGLPPPPEPGEGWRPGLARWAWAELAVYRLHPWALSVPISGPPVMPNALSWVESGLQSMRSTGLSEGEKMSVILLLTGYVRNAATVAVQVDAAFLAVAPDGQDAMSAYTRLLRRLIDPYRFPGLTAVLASGVLDATDEWDDEFTFGLDRVLDGIGALVTARA